MIVAVFRLAFLVVTACLLAGLYGAVHNQISYSVAAEYFTAFKFDQFNISETLPDRLGAAIVGWRASWWMGLIIGLPIALMSLAMPTPRAQVRAFLKVAFFTVTLTLALGLLSLLLPILPEHETLLHIPAAVSDREAFIRAGLMHSTSYLAGGISALIGLAWMGWMVWRARKRT